MNIEIKNNHSEEIKLLVKINGTEQQVDIPSGKSIVTDKFETRVMKIYKRKGLISISDLKESLRSEKPAITSESIVEHKMPKQELKSDLEPAYDAPNLDDDIKNIEPPIKTPETDRLQVAEVEVKQYIEDGFIKGEWSEDEVKFLTKEYPRNGRKYCAANLNRNETSVQKKIDSLGLRKRKKRKK